MDSSDSIKNDIIVKRKSITYEHDLIYYVPVFQKDFNENGDLLSGSTFTYQMELATQDEQMAASFNPDYILELHGHFKAATKPLIIKDE